MREDIIMICDKAPDENLFRLQLAGISYCDGSYIIRRSRQNVFVFEYVMKGKGFLHVDGKKFYPVAGDAYIVHAGTNHVYGSSSEEPWEKIWMNVSGALVKNLIELYGLQNISHIADCPVGGIFRKAISAIRKGKTHATAALAVHEIVMSISNLLKSRAGTGLPEDAVKLKNFLDKNMKNDVSLEDMAECISKSPSQTIRIFKDTWGSTPYRYLLDNRIDYACTLLRNTGMTIKEIAFELGFKDEYYFSNIFKSRTGHRPSEIRKNIS